MLVTALIFVIIVGYLGWTFRAHLKAEWAKFHADVNAQRPPVAELAEQLKPSPPPSEPAPSQPTDPSPKP